MRKISIIALMVSVCVLLVSCQDKSATTERDSAKVQKAQPAAVAKPAKPSAEIVEKCKLFMPPWGEENWSEWWQANPEKGEKWFSEVQGNMAKADLSIISKCTHLTNMLVGFAPLTDLKVFAGLTQLKRLDVRFAMKVTDLSPLASLKNLEHLSIWSTSVSDLSPLKNLDKLKTINARMTKITDLKPIANMKSLEGIDLLKTEVSDISPLAKVPNIKDILVCTTNVGDLSPLYKIAEKIRYLDLCNTPFVQYQELKKFSQIKILKLWGKQLGKLDFLTPMLTLEELDLSETTFESLKPIYNLKNLKKITMLKVQYKQEEIDELKRSIPGVELILALD